MKMRCQSTWLKWESVLRTATRKVPKVQVQILTDFLLKLFTVAQEIKSIGEQTGQSRAQKM